MKKILALVLVLAMIALCAVASAATITIEPQKPDTASAATTQPTYNYYVMLKASVGDGAVSYYVDDQTHATTIDGLKVGSDDLFTVTKAAGSDVWNVSINKKADGTAFTGKEVAEALQTIKTTNYGSGTATAGNDGTSTVTINGDGYVLIESSLGTALIVDTYTIDTVKEKNTYPGNTKTEDKSNAEIGEVVTYTVTVTIPQTVAEKDIVVVDTATDGLTMNTAITVTGGTGISSLTFELDSTDNETGANTYKATIPAATVIANAGKVLTLTYTATVNENAIVNDPEVNKAHIEYDNFKTVDVEVTEKTFGFDLLKVDGANTNLKLAGVVFTLTNGDGEYYTEPTNASNKDEDRFTSTYATIATAEGGTYTFAGLHAGQYTLTEISNPNPGYNLLTSPITITMGADGKISYSLNGTDTTSDAVSITVANNKGTELPSTGGIGTTIFYILGGVLIVAAAVILVARKKASN